MEEILYIYLRNNIEYVTPSYSVAFTRSNDDTEIVTLIK